jgi:hypothetical protein
MKTYLTLGNQLRIETDPEIIATLERKGWVNNPPPAHDPETQTATFDGEWHITTNPLPTYTAEAWLSKEGYGAVQLVTLLNLEAELTARALVSPKLDAVKDWTNAILGEYVQSNQPKEDWGAAPFSFNETVVEAYSLLG